MPQKRPAGASPPPNVLVKPRPQNCPISIIQLHTASLHHANHIGIMTIGTYVRSRHQPPTLMVVHPALSSPAKPWPVSADWMTAPQKGDTSTDQSRTSMPESPCSSGGGRGKAGGRGPGHTGRHAHARARVREHGPQTGCIMIHARQGRTHAPCLHLQPPRPRPLRPSARHTANHETRRGACKYLAGTAQALPPATQRGSATVEPAVALAPQSPPCLSLQSAPGPKGSTERVRPPGGGGSP